MMTFLFFIFLGSILGFFLGLMPGMHINNLLPFLLSLLPLFPSPLHLSTFIASFSVSQLISSFLPSIFLGAPNAETCLSVLPGHRMLLKGEGKRALCLMISAALTSSLLSFFLISFSSDFFRMLYHISRPYVHLLIIFVIFLMLLYEKDWKKAVTSTLILMLSGLFGFLVLNSPFSRENILFPMLSGMFGLSTILLSVMEESHIPEQHETNLNVHPKGFLTAVFMGCLAGIVVGFLPAIGVSQAVLLIQQIGGIRETEMFLISLASVNMANEIFSLNSLYLLNNPRSGSSIAIQKILGEVDLECNMLLTSSILISTFLASCIVWSISDRIIKLLEKCDYKKLNITTSFAIILMVWVFTGVFGIFILLISTSLGLLCNLVGAKRSYCMGSLLIPSITFFAGIQPIILEKIYA